MAHLERRKDLESQKRAPAKDSFVWDDEVPQLAARTRGKAHTWIVQTRRDGKTVRPTIGDVADYPVEIARAKALVILEELADTSIGLDPDISLADFAERFLLDCQHQWKASTFGAHGKCVHAKIVPALGRIKMAALDRMDVHNWRRDMACAAGTKNRALAVLSSMVRHAELVGIRPPGKNPCAGLRRHQSDFKAEYLDAAGYADLNSVLDAQSEAFPRAVPCIRFIMFTGCRSGEAKAIRWDQLDGSRITLPDAKSGPKSIWLGKPARDLLASLPKTGPGIFAGEDVKALGHELTRLWKVVRTTLKRPKLRIHDLRHSYASVAVNMGYDLRVVGGLLGHRDIETTAGYAHLDTARVADASERVGRHLGRAFAEPKAKPTRKAKAKPKPKPIPKPTLTPKAPHKRSGFARFVTSKLSLTDFCQTEGLDPIAFRRGLVAWRAQTGGRA